MTPPAVMPAVVTGNGAGYTDNPAQLGGPACNRA
jgi:hypothetical protein